MEIHLADGNPIIALVLISLSTFKASSLTAAFTSVSLSFATEEAADQFVKDIQLKGSSRSSSKSGNVVIFPDFVSSENAARAIYHAVNAYRTHLGSYPMDKRLSINRMKQRLSFAVA